MSSWTPLPPRDAEAGDLFAAQRVLLLLHNECWNFFPHLINGTTLSIRRAEQTFYSYDDTSTAFADQAIQVEWKFNAAGCANVSCVTTVPPGKTCTPYEQPFGLLTGANLYNKQDAFDTNHILNVCQPACFNLRPKRAGIDLMNNATDSHPVFPPTTVWNNEKQMCQYDISSATMRFLLDPSVRVSDGYSPLRDDVAFTMVRQKLTTFPEATTSVGRISVDYCTQFQMLSEIDSDSESLDSQFVNQKCAFTGPEEALSLVTGHSLIQLYKLSKTELDLLIRRAIGTRSTDAIQRYPVSESRFTNVDLWRAQKPRLCQTCVPVNVTLKDLGLVGVHKWSTWTNDPSHVAAADGVTDKYGGVILAATKNRLKRAVISQPAALSSERPPFNASSVTAKTAAPSESKTNLAFVGNQTTIDQFIMGIAQILSSPETYASLGAGTAAGYFVSALRTNVKRTINVLADIVERGGVRAAFGFGVGSPMAVRIIEYVSVRGILSVSSISATATVLRKSASLLASSANIVSWLFIIGPILDLLFTFVVDPLKLNNQAFTDYQLQKLTEADLESRARASSLYGEYQPADVMYRYLISDDANFLVRRLTTTLEYMTLYCANVRIDSNGTVVDWNSHGLAPDSTEVGGAAIVRAFQTLSVLAATRTATDDIIFNQRHNGRASNVANTSWRFYGAALVVAILTLVVSVVAQAPQLFVLGGISSLLVAAIGILTMYTQAFDVSSSAKKGLSERSTKTLSSRETAIQ